MARKSRRTEHIELMMKKYYKTAIYVRLSLEDSGKAGTDAASVLRNQIEFLIQYLYTKPDLMLAGVYSDNGYSGTHFNRPEWIRLMEDVRNKMIDCIVVKDLSRLGRDYIDTGDYMENVFPILGIRLIAVNDGYDSIQADLWNHSMQFNIKNIINHFYAKDISMKVSSSIGLKQKTGVYQGSHPPYGYLYAENCHKLVIEEETAIIVQKIFHWILDQYSDTQIAHLLTEMGIRTPNVHFYELGFIHSNQFAHPRNWNRTTIGRIAQNQVYLGYTVRAKSRKSLYHNEAKHEIPKENWIVVKNTHCAIIEEELFQRVQEIRERHRK